MTGVSNVADLVRTAAVRGPDHPAFIDAATGDALTWAEVDAATDVEAHRLRDAGLQPGDRVAVRLPTSAEFAVAVFGALRAGGVVVPVSGGGPTRELTRVLNDSGAALLVGDGSGVATTTLAAPKLRVDGGLTGGTDTRRFRADDKMFAIGFIPDRDNVRALFGGEPESAQLRFCLLSKTVTDADGEFREFEHLNCVNLYG